VLGLITVMANLGDPSKLGAGIATAFVATVYGVGAANLLFLPVANKLKVLVRWRVRTMDMILEGLVGIAVMEKPIQLEMRLRSFVHGGEKAAADGQADEGAGIAQAGDMVEQSR
jgi:chemotaxis protein MotA